MSEDGTMSEQEMKDFQKRLEAFQAEQKPLLEKYDVVLLTRAVLTPDGRITSQLIYHCAIKFAEQQQALAESNLNRKGRRANKIASPE